MRDIRRDVVGAPALQFVAGQFVAMLKSIPEVARRMAFRAMAERGRKIRTAVPLRRLGRIGREALALEKRSIPKANCPALIEGKREIVASILLLDGGHALEIFPDGEHIAAAQACIRDVG